MNDEAFNMSMRKFLKRVGVTSQQQIEEAVRAAEAGGGVAGPLTARVVLTIDGLDLRHEISGEIDLSGSGDA